MDTRLKEIVDSLVSKLVVLETAKDTLKSVLEDGEETTGRKKADLKKMATLEYLRRYDIDKYYKRKEDADLFDIVENLFGDE